MDAACAVCPQAELRLCPGQVSTACAHHSHPRGAACNKRRGKAGAPASHTLHFGNTIISHLHSTVSPRINDLKFLYGRPIAADPKHLWSLIFFFTLLLWLGDLFLFLHFH